MTDDPKQATATEANYTELLDVICGRTWPGPGFTTYPADLEYAPNNHPMCLELERRGLIKRWATSTPEVVTWVGVDVPDYQP